MPSCLPKAGGILSSSHQSILLDPGLLLGEYAVASVNLGLLMHDVILSANGTGRLT